MTHCTILRDLGRFDVFITIQKQLSIVFCSCYLCLIVNLIKDNNFAALFNRMTVAVDF